jgi:hypothetical protein
VYLKALFGAYFVTVNSLLHPNPLLYPNPLPIMTSHICCHVVRLGEPEGDSSVDAVLSLTQREKHEGAGANEFTWGFGSLQGGGVFWAQPFQNRYKNRKFRITGWARKMLFKRLKGDYLRGLEGIW